MSELTLTIIGKKKALLIHRDWKHRIGYCRNADDNRHLYENTMYPHILRICLKKLLQNGEKWCIVNIGLSDRQIFIRYSIKGHYYVK